jgi:hypothetical protein
MFGNEWNSFSIIKSSWKFFSKRMQGTFFTKKACEIIALNNSLDQ